MRGRGRLRAAGRFLMVTAVPLTVLGALTGGPAAMGVLVIAVPVGAAIGWSAAGQAGRAATARVDQAAAWGAAAAIGVFVLVGGTVLAGSLAVVVAVVAVAAATGRSAWRRSAVEGPGQAALGALTDAQLVRQWHASYGHLRRAADVATFERILGMRRRQLDEIERRDPVAFRRWLQSGCWVRGDSAPGLGH